MKSLRVKMMCAALLLGIASASAQYYEMANQLQRIITPALTGGFNYKGFVDASYLKGLGDKNADFLELTTTQGFTYSSWFFMGVGAGVEVIFTNPHENANPWQYDYDYSKGHSKTGWIIPLYTDFRFNIGDAANTSFFIDVRIGASFLLSNKYLEIGDGFLSNNEHFYLKPALGIRIPMNDSGKQALNVGLSYQLMTSNYWYRDSRDITLNSLGVSLGFEW